MTPRTEVDYLKLAQPIGEVLKTVRKTSYTRLPLCEGDIDHVIGFFHAKDLLRIPAEQREQPVPDRLIRQMLVVPESIHLHPLLLEMRKQRQHFALVLDEHGGTAGIVTLEDLLEELVGEIEAHSARRHQAPEEAIAGELLPDGHRGRGPGRPMVLPPSRVVGVIVPCTEKGAMNGTATIATSMRDSAASRRFFMIPSEVKTDTVMNWTTGRTLWFPALVAATLLVYKPSGMTLY